MTFARRLRVLVPYAIDVVSTPIYQAWGLPPLPAAKAISAIAAVPSSKVTTSSEGNAAHAASSLLMADGPFREIFIDEIVTESFFSLTDAIMIKKFSQYIEQISGRAGAHVPLLTSYDDWSNVIKDLSNSIFLSRKFDEKYVVRAVNEFNKKLTVFMPYYHPGLLSVLTSAIKAQNIDACIAFYFNHSQDVRDAAMNSSYVYKPDIIAIGFGGYSVNKDIIECYKLLMPVFEIPEYVVRKGGKWRFNPSTLLIPPTNTGITFISTQPEYKNIKTKYVDRLDYILNAYHVLDDNQETMVWKHALHKIFLDQKEHLKKDSRAQNVKIIKGNKKYVTAAGFSLFIRRDLVKEEKGQIWSSVFSQTLMNAASTLRILVEKYFVHSVQIEPTALDNVLQEMHLLHEMLEAILPDPRTGEAAPIEKIFMEKFLGSRSTTSAREVGIWEGNRV